ncbi:hypothetical protein [Burkholderia ubonensis]|uniref:hypothetical protein n=1 Tax=Burkholderia ubonensis TaxID=101571 RepID=UPI002ABD878A|nr:hypothetical protein [Burkholderia ubonensis]
MSGMHSSIMPTLFQDSKADGPLSGPAKLLDRIQNLENPLQSMGGPDRGTAIFSLLAEDFGFVALGRTVPDQLTAENRARWVSLLRWLWQGLESWRASADPKYRQLAALFAVADYCNFRAAEWAAMPDSVGDNSELMDKLVELHGRFASSFVAPAGAREPLWERETVDRFARAEKENDWLTVSELWRVFENSVYVNSFQTQLVNCLCRFDSYRLSAAFAGIDSFVTAFVSASALTIRDRLNVSVQTGNAKVRFAGVFSVLHEWPRIKTLGEDEQSLLTSTLAVAATDEREWGKWMAVFNRFPVRYPVMQAALGRALTACPDASLQAYVDSVHLFANSAGSRDAIGACLHAFAASASPDRRRLMWTLAFERWSEWNFGVVEGPHMFEIAWSEFDYAIVAYCLECLDEESRRKKQHAIVREIYTVEDRWHRSFTDFVTERNRLLSILQPYAHADHVAENGGSHLAPRHYSPDNPSDRYVQILIGTR